MSVKKYCYCENNCKYETLDKEEILAAIAQAVATGKVGECDTGFITTIKTINGQPLRFFVGDQSEYAALADKSNLFAIITNDTTKDNLLNALTELQTDYREFSEGVRSGSIVVGEANKAAKAEHAKTAAVAESAVNAESANTAEIANELANPKYMYYVSLIANPLVDGSTAYPRLTVCFVSDKLPDAASYTQFHNGFIANVPAFAKVPTMGVMVGAIRTITFYDMYHDGTNIYVRMNDEGAETLYKLGSELKFSNLSGVSWYYTQIC